MNEFVTIESLGTFAVMAVVVSIVTELLKKLVIFKSVDEQIISTCTGIIFMLALTIVLGTYSAANILLAIVNGVIVGFSSNGMYDAVQSLNARKKLP